MKAQKNFFVRFANKVACWMGHPIAFLSACLIILTWAISGPLFKFSDTWQLVINTGTTIITFLMVFLIQNSQNRDSKALQLKLDELIRALEGPHNALLDLEELSEKELEQVKGHYLKLAKQARSDLKKGLKDTGQVPMNISKNDKKSEK